MKKFGIFEIVVVMDKGKPEISFTGITNPLKKGLIYIDATDESDAVSQAFGLLETLGAKTSELIGNYDTYISEFPKYFVGELRLSNAADFETESLAYRIHNFIPVTKPVK